MSLSTLWQDCLSQLQDQVSPMDLSTWLRPLQADVISQDQVVLYASNMFVKSWVEIITWPKFIKFAKPLLKIQIYKLS